MDLGTYLGHMAHLKNGYFSTGPLIKKEKTSLIVYPSFICSLNVDPKLINGCVTHKLYQADGFSFQKNHVQCIIGMHSLHHILFSIQV